MEEMRIQVKRPLTAEEDDAVRQACRMLERAFGRDVHSVFITPDKHDPSKHAVFAVNISFDASGFESGSNGYKRQGKEDDW